MNYLAPLTLETSLLSLREAYQRNAKVSFDDPQPSVYGTYYGYKDIALRNQQTKLIEAFAKIPLPQDTNSHKAAYIEKMRLMVAICYLTQQQIIAKNKLAPVGSELNKLLNEALDLSTNNQLDTLTLQNCLLVLENFDFSKFNSITKKTILSPVEWHAVCNFARTTRLNLTPTTDSVLTTNLSFATGIIFQPMGWGFGFALGQTFGRAGQTGVVKKALTNTLTSGLVLLAPLTGTTAAAATFFGRPHAEQAVEYAAGYATAQFFGYSFKKIGQCTGWVIGKGIEIAYDTTSKLGKKAYNNIIDPEKIAELDIHVGIDLVSEDISSKSKTLSQTEVIEKVQEIIDENELNTSADDEEHSAPTAHVLQFRLSEQEHKLLPQVLTIFGYKKEQPTPAELLEFEKEGKSLTA